jgi:hypothetical protein
MLNVLDKARQDRAARGYFTKADVEAPNPFQSTSFKIETPLGNKPPLRPSSLESFGYSVVHKRLRPWE